MSGPWLLLWDAAIEDLQNLLILKQYNYFWRVLKIKSSIMALCLHLEYKCRILYFLFVFFFRWS